MFEVLSLEDNKERFSVALSPIIINLETKGNRARISAKDTIELTITN